MAELRICDVGGEAGVAGVPWGGDDERKWPTGAKAFFYFLFLGYFFLGVAIVSDIFMEAIEAITSKKKKIKIKNAEGKLEKIITVNVWNDTVSNLTLMALGSSAPEILLSCIELIGSKPVSMVAGKLGPSTIVGSAAFNLLMIIAVCIYSIPPGQTRTIKELQAYYVTAFFSVFAYVWLIVILQVNTPDVVDSWEAIVTFVMFPILVLIAYAADRGLFKRKVPEGEVAEDEETLLRGRIEQLAGEPDVLEKAIEAVRRQGGQMKNSELLEHLAVDQKRRNNSRAWHRMEAMRSITAKQEKDFDAVEPKALAQDDQSPSGAPDYGVLNVFIGFPTADIKFGKTKQEAKIPIAFMNVIQKTTVEVTTVAGTAQENTHFTPMKQTLTLMPGEIHQYVTVPLTGAQEDGMTFSLQLSDAKVETGTTTPTTQASDGVGGGEAYPLKTNDDASSAAASNQTAEIRRAACNVTIKEGIEEQPGMVTFGFDFREIQGKHETHTKPLNMFRVNGASGVVSCKVSTERNTAVAGKDYEEITDEEIFFQDGETRQELMLTILHKNDYEGRENFLLKAHDATNGLEFNPADDGGDECNMQTIYVLPTGKGGGLAKLVMGCCNKVFNCDELTKGMETWAGQYKSALYPGGDYESMQEATSGDMVMHLLSLPWKLLFAAIPPTEFWGGKITFVGALTFIGLMTAVIGDLAASFGCVIDLPDEITAITFVALGTSLPDTFASRTSAMMDDTADASIGNVTGSNSVNVFLGLGLPWTLGALHWEGKGSVFAVPAGNLVFSVIVFVIVALMCFSVLAARRRAFGGELGGPEGPKLLSAIFLTSLWTYYIAMSSWRTLLDKDGVEPSTGEQIGVLALGFVVLFVVAFALSTLVGMCSAGEPDPAPLEMKDGMVVLKVDEARKKYASNVLLELAGKDSIEKTDMMKQVKLMSTALGEMQKFVDGFEDKLRKLTEADDPADTPSKASE